VSEPSGSQRRRDQSLADETRRCLRWRSARVVNIERPPRTPPDRHQLRPRQQQSMRVEASGASRSEGRPDEDNHFLHCEVSPNAKDAGAGHRRRPCLSDWRIVSAGKGGEGPRPSGGRPDGRAYHRHFAAFRAGERPEIGAPPMTTVIDDGRVVAIGADACLALAGASRAIRHWDARLRHDCRVKVQDTIAPGSRSD
jgi:hypothetical protein